MKANREFYGRAGRWGLVAGLVISVAFAFGSFRKAPAAPSTELAQAGKDAGDVIAVLKTVPGLSKLPVSDVKTVGTATSAKVTLKGKSATVVGFKVAGSSMAAVVPSNFHITDIVPVPSGTPIDGVSFADMAFLYVPKGHAKKNVTVTSLPAPVRTAVQHFGSHVSLNEGFNVFGQGQFNSAGAIKQVLQAVGHSNTTLPLAGTFAPDIFGHDLKEATTKLKDDLLKGLKLDLPLPKLHIPGMPNMVGIDSARLAIVGAEVKGKAQVYAGVTGALHVKIGSKQHDFSFGMFAPQPGKAFTPELKAESKDRIKLPFFHPLDVSGLQLVATRKGGKWDAVVDGTAKLNNKAVSVAIHHDTAGDSAEVTGKIKLADLLPSGVSVPGITDVEFDKLVIAKDSIQVEGKIKGLDTDVEVFKHNSKTYVAVSNPHALKISSLISQAKGTPLDAGTFQHMTYVWAPQGGAINNLKPTDLPTDAAHNTKQVVSNINLKPGLNVIGRMDIDQNSDIHKVLDAVGVKKDWLPLVGNLSPKLFQKGDTTTLKNEILDSLDIKLPLKVSGLHLPSSVQIKSTNLEIKGIKDKADKRGVDMAVRGELDTKIHTETLKLGFEVVVDKTPGKPAEVRIDGKTKPGTKLTLSLVEKFTLTELDFDLRPVKGKWQSKVDAKTTLNGKPVDVTYALYAGREPSLTFNTKMTIAELIGQKNLPGLDDVELDTVMTRPGMWFLHATIKGQPTYFQIQKVGSKHLIAAYLYSLPLTELIPGSKNSPLKDVKFSNVVALYNPGKVAQAWEAGLRYDAWAWVAQSNKNNPVVYPGLNIFGYMDIHPSGELANLLKEVGIKELKLPLNGRFNPKAFAKNPAAIKNEILANLDMKVPLPAISIPGAPGGITFGQSNLIVTAPESGGKRAVNVELKGEVTVKAMGKTLAMDYDTQYSKARGINFSAFTPKGSTVTFSSLDSLTLVRRQNLWAS